MEFLLILLLLIHLLLGVQRTTQADCDPEAQQAEMIWLLFWRGRKRNKNQTRTLMDSKHRCGVTANVLMQNTVHSFCPLLELNTHYLGNRRGALKDLSPSFSVFFPAHSVYPHCGVKDGAWLV